MRRFRVNYTESDAAGSTRERIVDADRWWRNCIISDDHGDYRGNDMVEFEVVVPDPETQVIEPTSAIVDAPLVVFAVPYHRLTSIADIGPAVSPAGDIAE